MGYELHITRSRDWLASEADPIGEEDCGKLVDADPELKITEFAETSTPQGILRIERLGLTRWSGHPHGQTVWFDLDKGRVSVKNPDEAVVTKMIAVATSLGARVVGDEGEVYD